MPNRFSRIAGASGRSPACLERSLGKVVAEGAGHVFMVE